MVKVKDDRSQSRIVSSSSSLKDNQSGMLPLPTFLAHLQEYQYRWLTGLSLLLALALTLLISHDQRRLHMPEPWSYALAAQNFAQGNWYSFLGV